MDKKELVLQYLEKLLVANETTNLTRISSWEEALVLHIEDSLVALEEINAAPEGLYGDLGTGGGFPGVPLAIYTGRETVLVDSVKKKVRILADIVSEIGMSETVSTYGGRIEDLAKEKPGAFSVLTARALSQLNSLLELSSPLLKRGGQLICYKAKVSEEEIQSALDICDLVGMKLLNRRSLVLSDGITTREIIVFQKIGSPKVKLPRNVGMAQHNPLVKK
ncbi:MAG: 16S rRNA (guanine(527)-N(7))-methyltransferase RsmG [Eggerthellaceae bacterium]|nr:16S rRNA (guanine(527)-N(7))-methyltransferase RsmG [Eggerthellaceae bacterium]